MTAAPLLRSLRRRGWTLPRLLAVPALAAIAVLATLDAWSDIYSFATRHEESSHILLVPVVAAWLLWVRRERFRGCALRGSWVGPLCAAAGWALYSSGDLLLVQALWHAGAVLVVLGCILSVAGKDMLTRFFCVFVVLLFLVPVPGAVRQAIALPLQTATAKATQAVLEVLNLPASRSGNLLEIRGVQVAIDEACNGLRMVFALTLVSVAFALGTPLRTYVRVIVVAASPLSAILCNVIRLVPTVWLYGYSSLENAELFHDLSGWIMLPVAFLILMGILRALRWALLPLYRYNLAYGR